MEYRKDPESVDGDPATLPPVSGGRHRARGQRRGREDSRQVREGAERLLQLVFAPRYRGVASFDLLEGQRDPATLALVVGPQQARNRRLFGQRGSDTGLLAVDRGGGSVGLGPAALTKPCGPTASPLRE